MANMEGNDIRVDHTLEDAKINIRCLDDIHLPDHQPNIEAEPASIRYCVNFDTNFEDRGAFIFGVGRYNEEATRCSNLNEILEEGNYYSSMLYTWRSISRAIPQVSKPDQPNRVEIYESTLAILEPEVQKLRDFLKFIETTITRFCDELRELARPQRRKDFISETYHLTLAKLLNMFAILDALKDMKSCINNDFACYRRAESILKRGEINAFVMEQEQKLSMFFAKQKEITHMLKDNLEKIDGYEEVLSSTIILCYQHFENEMYLLPHDKYTLLKAIGYGMLVLDSNAVNINKLRRINMKEIDRIFKHNPVAPLYGDVSIILACLVRELKHYDPAKWTCTLDEVEDKTNLSILQRLPIIRNEHIASVAELARRNNEFKTSSSGDLSEEQIKDLYHLAYNSIRKLTSWTCQLHDMHYWKLSHPADPLLNKNCPHDASNYEKAIRYNYSLEEKFAVTELLAMIKGLSRMLVSMEELFTEAITLNTHQRMQTFLQRTLREIARPVVKKKKQDISIILMSIRDTAVDLMDGVGGIRREDPAWKGEKDPKNGYHVEIPKRKVPPSSTQIYMVRTMLESLLQEGLVKGKSLDSMVSSNSVQQLKDFHKESFFFSELINFPLMIREASDLSQLWYREFFLELTMGANIQFPIDQSLPWILTSCIIESKEKNMLEYLLYPLDLYCDSAFYALYKFKKQYLFDEIEAEVNLIFDQLIFKVAQMVLTHAKQRASSIILDNTFRSSIGVAGVNIPFPKSNRLDTILKQRHVQLLGRSIDMHGLIGERIRSDLFKSVDMAIAKFESSDLSGIIELDILLRINKLTLELLSEHVDLDPFSAIYDEANDSVSSSGKVESHILSELVQDFLPNYNYNSQYDRFVKTKHIVSDINIDREKEPRAPPFYFYGKKELKDAFATIIKLHEGFIGQQHFSVMARLLGYDSTCSIVTKLLTLIKGQVSEEDGIIAYVNALKGGMPPKCKLPSWQYGTIGVAEFFYAQVEPLVTYQDLKTNVFQAFREFGNTILFFILLEKAMGEEEMMDLHLGAPFLAKMPKPHVKPDESQEMAVQHMEQMYGALHLAKIAQTYGDTIQASNAKHAELLTKERLCRGLTLFEKLMCRMRDEVLNHACFVGQPPSNGVMNIEECDEFHRIWSAIQFVMCVPEWEGHLPEEVFGDGLIWGGITIIYLLGQIRRFEALDFCYHILNVHHLKPPPPLKDPRERHKFKGQDLGKIIKRIKVHKQVNKQVTSILDKFLSHSQDFQQTPKEFTPPIYSNPLSAV